MSFALGSAVNLLDSKGWGFVLHIEPDLEKDFPYAAVEDAKGYVMVKAGYYKELGKNTPGTYSAVGVEITGLSVINSGTAGLTTGVNMYFLEWC